MRYDGPIFTLSKGVGRGRRGVRGTSRKEITAMSSRIDGRRFVLINNKLEIQFELVRTHHLRRVAPSSSMRRLTASVMQRMMAIDRPETYTHLLYRV